MDKAPPHKPRNRSHPVHASDATTHIADTLNPALYSIHPQVSYNGPSTVRGKPSISHSSLYPDPLYCFPILNRQNHSESSFLDFQDVLNSEDLSIRDALIKIQSESPFLTNLRIEGSTVKGTPVYSQDSQLQFTDSLQDIDQIHEHRTESDYVATNEEALITYVCNDQSIVQLLIQESSILSSVSVKYKKSPTKQNPLRQLPPKSLNDSFEQTLSSMISPLYSKVVVCSGQYSKLRILHSWASTGYTSPPVIEYSDVQQSSRALMHTKNRIIDFLSPDILSFCCKTRIVLLSCGYEHCLSLSDSGSVMSWGFGGGGCLGHGSFDSFIIPTYISGLMGVTITFIEAGGYHSCAISDKNNLYAWGRNDFNQLGLVSDQLKEDDSGQAALQPQKVSFFDEIQVSSVACGEAHTLVLTVGGLLFSFGWAADGQLGLPSMHIHANMISKSIHSIPSLKNLQITRISSGAFFSACIDSDGHVWCWGKGDEGQLGSSNRVLSADSPQCVSGIENAVDLLCGSNYVICFDQETRVFGWGMGVAGIFTANEQHSPGSELVCYQPIELSGVEAIQRVLLRNSIDQSILSVQNAKSVNKLKKIIKNT